MDYIRLNFNNLTIIKKLKTLEYLNKMEFPESFLNSIIKNNEYLNKTKSTKIKNEYSLSFLIDFTLSQSDCIKLGNAVEKILSDIIINSTDLLNIKEKNKKGAKEKDHLFMDDINKIIYYAEIKSNLYLDTEKTKATIKKCNSIYLDLVKTYPSYTIKAFLVGCRYVNKQHFHKNITKKYDSCVKMNKIINNAIICGVDDYLDELNSRYCFNIEETYKVFLNNIAKELTN